MKRSTLIAGIAGLSLAVGMTGVANSASRPKRATIKAVQTIKMKPNRYIQDGLRWNKDVYRIRSGGTVTVINNAADEGPHTLTVVREKDRPKTAAQVVKCKICDQLGAAHGADPNGNAPPKVPYLENGVGQATPPNLDKPGDSGVTGKGDKGERISFTVTARKGSELYLMCLIHPWMQAELVVAR
jgi:hypothetical protein